MAEPAPKPPRGCFHYGCIAGLVLVLVLVLGGLYGMHYAKKMVTDFTDPKPAPLPQTHLPAGEFDKLEQRLDAFRQAVRAGKATQPLVLTADEINALIAGDPDFSGVKGKLYITLDGDEIKGQVAIPMESVGLNLFKGRYLNGTGKFSLSLHRGKLRLFVLSFIVKNRAVPEPYMEHIRKYNWAEDSNRNPRVAAALDALKDIQVHDSKLIVLPK